MTHNGFNNYSFGDTTFEDFRHIVDFFSVYERVSTSPSFWSSRARKIKGVRMYTMEDEPIKFEQIYFPQDHPFILSRFDHPLKEDKERLTHYDIPGALQISLCWNEGPRDGHVEVCLDHLDLTKEVDFIRCCLMPEMEDRFHSCGPRRQMDFTFIREDLVDLKKEHMMAISDFCVDKIMGLQDNNSFVSEKARKYRDVATKKAFERFWTKCKRNYGWDKNIASPYETAANDQMEE